LTKLRTAPFSVVLLAILLIAGCAPGMGGVMNLRQGSQIAAGTKRATSYTGSVIGLNGQPAAEVLVKAYLISNNSGGIISNNSSSYRVLAGDMVTRTDKDGRFVLDLPMDQKTNIEAVLSEEVKAIRLGVDSGQTDLRLQLAYTGTITGRVTAPNAPSVTNFEGVDVFIPGSSYLAKADAQGRYTLGNVPVGSFGLVASKTGLGRGFANSVEVTSHQSTMAPDLALLVKAPEIALTSESEGGGGASLRLQGQNFGASDGTPWELLIDGKVQVDAVRLDDHTIQFKMPETLDGGELLVRIGGIPSNAVPLVLYKALSFRSFPAMWQVGKEGRVLVGAEDSHGNAINSPLLKWTVADSLATVSEGVVTFRSAGQTTLTASSGKLSVSMPIEGYLSKYQGRFPLVNLTSPFTRIWGTTEWCPGKLAIGEQGTFYALDDCTEGIDVIHPDGTVSALAIEAPQVPAGWNEAWVMFRDLVYDGHGHVYVLCQQMWNEGSFILQVEVATGKARTLVLTTNGVEAPHEVEGYVIPESNEAKFSSLFIASDGALFVGGASGLCRLAVNKSFTVLAREADLPQGLSSHLELAGDPAGNLYLADLTNNRLLMRTSQGQFSTLAAFEEIPGNSPQPRSPVWNADGHLYFFLFNSLYRITAAGQMEQVTRLNTSFEFERDEDESAFGFASAVDMGVNPAGDLFVMGDREIFQGRP